MGKYDELLASVREKNPLHAKHLGRWQAVADGIKRVVIDQKDAITYTTLGLFTHGPQNPISKEHADLLLEAMYRGSCRGLDISPEEVQRTLKAVRMGVGAHVFLNGYPGRGKTVICLTGASLVSCSWSRIQFTVDTEPSSVIGSEMINPVSGERSFQIGPVNANIVVADEINRATPKTQGATLEVLPEGQITRDFLGADGKREKRTIILPRPFFVVATANPIEQEGTFQLPEAQCDRFAMQVIMHGISIGDVMTVARINDQMYCDYFVQPVITQQEVLETMQYIHDHVYVSTQMERYMARLVKALIATFDLRRGKQETDETFLRAQASLRALRIRIGKKDCSFKDIIGYAMYERMAIVMRACAKTMAFIRGRLYVAPEDARKIFPVVARHRIFLTPEARGLLNQNPVTEDNRLLTQFELTDMVLAHIIRAMPIPLAYEVSP